MAGTLVARIRRSTAQAVEETFRDLLAAGRIAELAQEAEDAVRECLGYPELTRATWRQVSDAIMHSFERHELVDWQGYGESLQELLDAGLDVVNVLNRWVQTVKQQGQQVRNAAELEPVQTELQRLRGEVLDHWPWPMTAEEWAEANAEFERGESISLEEAFAGAAGVSVGEWLQRVEEHKKRHGL